MNPTYQVSQSYDWNFEHGPIFEKEIPKREIPAKKVELLGFKLNSRIGVPAGPLLNSNWIKLYAELGFDIPVYKTVRSVTRESHPQPNCVFVNTEKQFTTKNTGETIIGSLDELTSSEKITITNSFGMPSRDPKEWMTDIERANSFLAENQVMIVSVVGTPDVSENLEEDYARTAALAKEAGAKIIEANYSCPNVQSGEGSIFLDADFSAKISKTIRREIGDTPLLIKVGNFPDLNLMREVVEKNAEFVNGISGINTLTMKIVDSEKKQILTGEGRLTSGLCGFGIREIAQNFADELASLRGKLGKEFVICGVGGITKAADFTTRLQSADIAMSATGAMWNPLLASEYHRIR